MNTEKFVWGYVNGVPMYSEEDFVHTCRGCGAFSSDEELIAFAQKVTYNWRRHGWEQGFIGYYLSDYCMEEPYHSLTKSEFRRLKELQKEARDEYEREEAAREWHYVSTTYWADNSEEETWEDKDGNRKTIMTVGPHGDIC